MSCLHNMFKKAVEWEMIEESLFDKGKSLIIKKNNKRMRFLADDEIINLLDACPPFLHRIVSCALHTGMRKGEILGLKWDQVRNGFLYLDKTKTNEARQISINDDLKKIFKQIRKHRHLTSKHVFTYQGKAINDVKGSLNAAVKRSGYC